MTLLVTSLLMRWNLGRSLVGNPDPWPNLGIDGDDAVPWLWLNRPVGRFSWNHRLFPVPVLFFRAVLLLAIVNLERGSVSWHGRQFPSR